MTVTPDTPQKTNTVFHVEVQPQPALPVGRHTFDVVLRGVLAGGERIPDRKVPVFAQVDHNLSVVPEMILLGEVAQGQSVDHSVTLTPRFPAEYRVVGVESEKPDALSVHLVESETPDETSAATVLLRLTPLETGLHSSLVLLKVLENDVPQNRSVRVSYVGGADQQSTSDRVKSPEPVSKLLSFPAEMASAGTQANKASRNQLPFVPTAGYQGLWKPVLKQIHQDAG